MAKSSDSPKVTRIIAKDTNGGTPNKKSPAKIVAEKDVKSVKKQIDSAERKANIFKRIGGYFSGSWQELKLVRWPDRRATWKMTGALITFTVVFAIAILLLDYGFQQLFQALLSK